VSKYKYIGCHQRGHNIANDVLINRDTVRSHLERCGYAQELIREDYPVGEGDPIALVAFAHTPTDIRSACVAYIESPSDYGNQQALVEQARSVGAPVVFVGYRASLTWWRQGVDSATQEKKLPAAKVETFFKKHSDKLSPDAIYRAKTLGKFEKDHQLSFVDAGLMPAVERDIGQYITEMLERVVLQARNAIWPDLKQIEPQDGSWLMKSVFWLLAAKILKDKAVRGFVTARLDQIEDVFRRIDKHYNSQAHASSPIAIPSKKHLVALEAAGTTIGQTGSLAHTSTESLAYVYENTLISKATRAKLGTHSTPPYLVDYIVEKLAPWLEKIPVKDRHVFEPACGHAGFLVAAMRMLRSYLPADQMANRKDYLRRQLHGCDCDSFALEIARLSLTLADIPNSNGWDLKTGDIFKGDWLEINASRASLLLANPPFENFKSEDKEQYAQADVHLSHSNKAAEMLARTLPHLKPGSVFGVVLPQGFLHSKNSTDIRKLLCNDFQIQEICLFPDKMFVFSDAESAIILGRRLHAKEKTGDVSYRSVRDSDAESFKLDYKVTSKSCVLQDRFSVETDWSLRLPEMNELWTLLDDTCQDLDDIADVGKGLDYIGQSKLPENRQTISTKPFKGAVPGFKKFEKKIYYHQLPEEVWMNLDHEIINAKCEGAKTGIPQVIMNYGRVSRGPWKLKALIDTKGHAVTSRFLVSRPKNIELSLEYLWAILNSPIANAYAFTHSMKRDILSCLMRRLPIPKATDSQMQYIAQLARSYLDLVNQPGLQSPHRDETARSTMLRLDAEVLRLYDLPPRFERELLDLFAGHQRVGVPFSFERYYPDGFQPWFSLHEYLSPEYQSSTAGAMRLRKPSTPPEELLTALHHAAEAFGSDE